MRTKTGAPWRHSVDSKHIWYVVQELKQYLCVTSSVYLYEEVSGMNQYQYHSYYHKISPYTLISEDVLGVGQSLVPVVATGWSDDSVLTTSVPDIVPTSDRTSRTKPRLVKSS